MARQPIFDRNMSVFGYELLYRKSMNNFYEGTDDNQATAELLNNAFLTMHFPELTDGGKAFINFSRDMLLNDIPMLLPAQLTVVEVLERVEVDEDVVEVCRKLSEKGYIIALDDFVFSEQYLPLLEIAHIIKVEFPVVDHDDQRQLIKKYKNKIKFLAEKVETREEYQIAYDMGYDYFQGYFFSKPVIIKEKEIPPLNANLINIMELLNHGDPEYQQVAEIIGTDLGLSFKLLKLANTVCFGSKYEIRHLKQALVRLGFIEIKKWIYILLMKETQTIENKELIKTCFIRAKFMELMAMEIGAPSIQFEYFLTGMFSSIDVLTNKDMEEITNKILLPDSVRDALLGHGSRIKYALDIVTNYELLIWDGLVLDKIADGAVRGDLVNMYMEALVWVMNLNY
jgi:EAL and modified HD-GYP domain-containing signal transduction protein